MKKSGELRNFLLGAINDVVQGNLEEAEARNVIKLASQVNESLYSECKVAKIKMELGEEASKFGSLDLT